VRELTGVAIAGYGLVLLAGIICLARGEAAYKAWLDFLAVEGRWHCTSFFWRP
jgi:fumarate reductase subunit C